MITTTPLRSFSILHKLWTLLPMGMGTEGWRPPPPQTIGTYEEGIFLRWDFTCMMAGREVSTPPMRLLVETNWPNDFFFFRKETGHFCSGSNWRVEFEERLETQLLTPWEGGPLFYDGGFHYRGHPSAHAEVQVLSFIEDLIREKEAPQEFTGPNSTA